MDPPTRTCDGTGRSRAKWPRLRRPSSECCRATHHFIKLDSLVHLPRESIYQEAATALSPLALVLVRNRMSSGRLALSSERLAHSVLQQCDRHFHRDNLALLDVLSDQRTVFGTLARLLCAQKVAG